MTNDKISPMWPVAITTALIVVSVFILGFQRTALFAILWVGACILVVWTLRQDKPDRQFICRLLCIGAGLLLISLAVSMASGVVVNGTQEGDTILWQIEDGTPPYAIWLNGAEYSTNYPGTEFTSPVTGAQAHYVTVMDSVNETATGVVYPVMTVYPAWIWGLIAIWLIFCLLSARVYIASYGAAILGGLLMLMIVPDPAYAVYLRIAAAFIFVVGLSMIFIFRGE